MFPIYFSSLILWGTLFRSYFFLPGWLHKPFLRPFFSDFSEFGPYTLFGKFPVLSSFQWISDSPFAFSDTFAVIVGISEMYVWLPTSQISGEKGSFKRFKVDTSFQLYLLCFLWVGFESNWYILLCLYIVVPISLS